jgi:hypothetical protein
VQQDLRDTMGGKSPSSMTRRPTRAAAPQAPVKQGYLFKQSHGCASLTRSRQSPR